MWIETLKPPQTPGAIVARARAIMDELDIAGPHVKIVTDVGGRGFAMVDQLRAVFPPESLVFIELYGNPNHAIRARVLKTGTDARGRPEVAMIWSVSRTQLFTDTDGASDGRLSFSKGMDPDELEMLRGSARATQPKPGENNRLKILTERGDDSLLALNYCIYGGTYHLQWRGVGPFGFTPPPSRTPPSALAWT